MVVKAIKLKIHNRGSCDEELVLNLEAFPKENFRDGDIVEIRALDEQAKPLYLKVKDLAYELQQKGGPISVLSDVAQVFGLTGMKTVSVSKVERECASVDLVELTIKDHCLSRSDMWRFSNSLMDSCVYTSKKIQSCEMRAQVHSLWTSENTVDSGLVHSCTRVLFRSSSMHMFICVQICAEMWEFDANGTLYFDKALQGFLKKLVDHWTKEGCSHYVTIVFFSRTYYPYNSTALSAFPTHLRSAVCQDYRGVYYRDFFEIILEGQQSMDWPTVAKELKKSFKDYRQRTDCAEDNSGVKGVISRAPQGNVLECLNLTSNVFARKYGNPSFHRTGQHTVIVTPGVGVFEVDRELARITNERMMDFGISSDVVSLTEQPLHAVPLFKFQSVTKGEDGTVVDDYTIPHWFNYSFYDPASLWSEERFQPRIRLPDYMVNCHLKEFDSKRQRGVMKLPSSCSRSNTPNMFFRRESDFDDYDAKVFMPATKSERNVPQGVSGQISSPVVGGSLRRHRSNEHLAIGSLMPTPPKFGRPRLFSDRDSTNQMQMVRPAVMKRMHTCASESGESPSHRGGIPESDLESTLEVGTTPQSPAVGMQPRPVAKGSPSRVVGRPFINPFQPNELPQEISTNKRRWMHAFPTTSKGHAFQPHHVMQKEGEGGVSICSQSTESGSRASEADMSTGKGSDVLPEKGVNDGTDSLELSLKEDVHSTQPSDRSSVSPPNSPYGSEMSLSSAFSEISVGDVAEDGKKKKKKPKQSAASKRPLFEVTTSAVQPKVLDNFAPIRRTGVDWKALTNPACLPVTTDYFPSERTLADDYTVNLYTLLPLQDAESREKNHPHLSAVQCFRELISQRLSKGFQIVLSDSVSLFSLHETLERIANGAKAKKKKKLTAEGSLVVKMSLGRVCHFLTLTYPSISVAVHRAKHTPQFSSSKYSYSLQPCSQSSHQVVQCEFDHEKMEYYNWNYLDQHIMGYDDFDMLSDGLKYCHSRYLLLPGDCRPRLDSMEDEESRERSQVAEFVRFLEFLNHLRRPSGHSRRGSTDSHTSRYSSVASRESLGPKFSAKSRQSSQLSLLQLATGASITEVDEGRSRTPYMRTPSYDTSNPSSRPTSPAFYMVGSPLPRSSSADRSTPLLRVSSVDKDDTSGGHRLQRRQAVLGDEPQEKAPALVEREESEVSPEGDSPSPQPLHGQSSHGHEDKEQEAGPRGGGELPSQDFNADDSSSTLVKTDVTGATVTEVSPLIRQVSTAASMKNLEEGRVPQTDTFAEVVEAMMDTKNSRGIDFVFHQRSQLRSHCFIAIEAIEWFKEHVEGIHTSEEAVQLGQHMVDKGVLVHASGDRSVCFEVGFYLFCIADVGKTPESSLTITAPSLDHSYVIIEGCLTNFRRQWFEAGIVTKDSNVCSPPLDESPSLNSVNSSSPTAPLTMRSLDDSHFHGSPGSGGIDREWTSSRTVDLNPDPHGISDRPEWGTIIYDSVFIPQVAFQMEFQWVVTTAALLAKQISQWSRRADMCGFHLLPVPTWQNLDENPFSKPQCIPLLFNFERLHDMGVSCDSETMFSLVHKILKRFGFLLDPSSIADDMDCLYDAKHLNRSLSAWLNNNGIGWHSDPVYVHHSGACLVKPMKQSCSPLPVRTSSSTTGYLPRTDSECTIQASTPLAGLDYDDVFSARRFSRSSRSSYHSHSKQRHSTPCTSPDHALSPGGMNAMYSFLWYTNNLSAMQKPSSVARSNAATLLKEFQDYCASVNEHFRELLCHRELSPYDSIKSTGSNV